MTKDEKLLNDELFAAVTYGNLKTVKSLTKDGADINAIKYRETPLTLALRLKRNDIIHELIQDPKIDLQRQNTSGKTPLSLALEWYDRDTDANIRSDIDVNISKNVLEALREKLANERSNNEVQTSIEKQNTETQINIEKQSSDDALTPKEYKFGKNSKVYQILMNSDPTTIARKLSKAFQNKNTEVYVGNKNEVFDKIIEGNVYMQYFSIDEVIEKCPPDLIKQIEKISEKIDYKNKTSLSSIADKVKNFFTIVFSLGSSGVKDKDTATILDAFKPESVNLGSIGTNKLSNYKSKAEGMIADITCIPARFKRVELNAIKNYFASDIEKVFSITEILYATLRLLPEGLTPLSKALGS
jgi:hypothetical protein